MTKVQLKHFYIPDDQSVYLLSHKDAKKLKDWFQLCERQLIKLGYSDVELIGKGAFGFAFSGVSPTGQAHVFKFSKITLPQHIQDRLEEEAFMLSQVNHPNVPKMIEFQRVNRQSILVMGRAQGIDLEQYSLKKGPLPAHTIVKILVQLCDILVALRENQFNHKAKPIVHGDIKPSNLVWDESQEKLSLIDWGSCVFAQVDANNQYVGDNVMDLMSGDLHQTNARLGDVYFIGEDQLNGALSSPRFDEQGLASTLYALASGQSCRFGSKAISPLSLGLPQALAECLQALMSDERETREQAGDYLIKNYHYFKRIVFKAIFDEKKVCLLPTWISQQTKDIETVVYSSRKSFLRQQEGVNEEELNYIDDAQFERYYKNYLQGMGDTEKAFISSVSRLGKFPVVGGLAIRWQAEGIYVDSSLKLYDPELQVSFDRSVDNVILLARAIHRTGIFKCCMFNAKNTLHFERDDENQTFEPTGKTTIPYDMSKVSIPEDESRMHSYFEDGEDPDELLKLPTQMLNCIKELNSIHHTGCIIFEALPNHLKIHNYYTLLDHTKENLFKSLLAKIISLVPTIEGLGISGFMKLPYKDTRFFSHQVSQPTKFYPKNPYNG
ncbi:protein kinase domain-containing protein [Glaciecola sp. 1036]|uniref:protein kinase domain-containing protein n=1 Tax=Alteromonadaceae TaxID=72275 RepID=UPI003D05F48D